DRYQSAHIVLLLRARDGLPQAWQGRRGPEGNGRVHQAGSRVQRAGAETARVSEGEMRRRSFLPLLAAPAFAAKFTDITATAGLANARNVSGSADNKQYLLEEMGSGVALIDYDNDGWVDIFLVNGTSFDAARTGRKPTSYLFHNNRDGTFTDVTRKAGL